MIFPKLIKVAPLDEKMDCNTNFISEYAHRIIELQLLLIFLQMLKTKRPQSKGSQ